MATKYPIVSVKTVKRYCGSVEIACEVVHKLDGEYYNCRFYAHGECLGEQATAGPWAPGKFGTPVAVDGAVEMALESAVESGEVSASDLELSRAKHHYIDTRGHSRTRLKYKVRRAKGRR